MLYDYAQIRKNLKSAKPPMVSVAVAQDREVVRTIMSACKEGLARAVFVGDQKRIEKILGEEGFPSPIPIVHESDEESACRKAGATC
ncbi:MAG TPA: hypothetical protein PLD22_04920 [Bacillota bacterium]|nr:hypothetical protein [Bacillota bacterium]HPZ60236.1 hypothetical protein [Bacillota bacterium]HQC82652.1 hypothetical protein [Bacillota bacterium]